MDKELNNNINILKKSLLLKIVSLEDRILELYTHIDFDLTPQVKKGTPLYSHFLMVNPEHSSEKLSKVEMKESDKHISGVIQVLTNNITSDPSDYGLIVISR